MRRSTRLAQNQPKREPQIKKSRLDDRISNISTIDNGTMVESLKYLNYMQLAQASFVSKRFSNLICTHRRSLALLYVNSISMTGPNRYATPIIKICGKVMSLGKWDQWSSDYNYSKQIPLKELEGTCVLHARVELKHEYWALFEHFVCLLTDPFTYIAHVQLTPRIDVFFLNFLTGAINPEYNRLQCNTMDMHLSMTSHENSIHQFIDWMKNCVYCNKFGIFHDRDSNFYGNAPKQPLRKVASEELLDFFMTGAHCTSAISVNYCDISNAIVAFLQVN
ncbi:hypothetical protein Ddc_18427 [Ditylenchus destructor]|nr:hypothetical protein Ddc_18427 [Ditylenchus destructor]